MMCMNWAKTLANVSPNKTLLLWGSSHTFFFVSSKCAFSQDTSPHNLLYSVDHTWVSCISLVLFTRFSFLCQTLEFLWFVQYWHSFLFCRKHISVALSLGLMSVCVFNTHEDSCISVLILFSSDFILHHYKQ